MERIEHVARLETKYLEVADAALTEAEHHLLHHWLKAPPSPMA